MKVINPFANMSNKILDAVVSMDAESRNLKDREKYTVKRRVSKMSASAGNFLKLQTTKKATA